MFRRKGTQDGEGVACFVGKVRKVGKVLHVLQEGYARWERCCTFCRKSTQGGYCMFNFHLVENDFKTNKKPVYCCYYKYESKFLNRSLLSVLLEEKQKDDKFSSRLFASKHL